MFECIYGVIQRESCDIRPRNRVAMLSLIRVHLTLLRNRYFRYKINFINFLRYCARQSNYL